MAKSKLPPIPWDKLEALKKPHKLGIFFGTHVLIIGLVFYFLIYPVMNDIKTLDDQIETAENKLAVMTSRGRLDKIREAPEILKKLNRELEISQRFLPDKDQVEVLLKNVSARAQASGLNVLEFKPTRAKNIELKGGFLAEVPFASVVEGPYVNIASFLYKISQLPRIVHIKTIRLTNPVMREGELILSASLTGTTYRFVKTVLPDESVAGK